MNDYREQHNVFIVLVAAKKDTVILIPANLDWEKANGLWPHLQPISVYMRKPQRPKQLPRAGEWMGPSLRS